MAKKATAKKSKKKCDIGSTRGGFRKGAGRKPKPAAEKMISISHALLPEMRDAIDERCCVENRGRSELLRRFCAEGLARKPKIRKKGKQS